MSSSPVSVRRWSRLGALWFASLVGTAPVAAQWPTGAPNAGQGGGQSGSAGQTQGGGGNAAGGGNQIPQWPPQTSGSTQGSPWGQTPWAQGSPLFPGVQQSNPEFRGFPSVTDRQGFGAYPNYPGLSQATKISPEMVPPVGPMRAAGLWPSWLTLGRSDESVRVRADRALLVRNAERVWYRAADDPVYVPLAFHDNVREMEAGAAVQVRTHTGEATLVFHDGGTLRATGTLHVEARILTEAVAEFELHDVHRAWLDARKRQTHLRLPDGSSVEASGALVYLARDGERLTVRNYGPEPVFLRSPLGLVEVPRTRQVQTLMSPVPETRVQTTLTVDGTVRARVQGRRAFVESGSEGGSVEWSGARLRLGPNQSASLDALAGDVFPEYRRAAVSTDSQAPR